MASDTSELAEAAAQVEEASVNSEASPKREHITKEMCVPFPATPINLELTGRTDSAFRLGRMVVISGESDTAKSLTALSILSEATLPDHLSNHRLIYDDTEMAMSFDIASLFSEELDTRLEVVNSTTIEDFEMSLVEALEHKKPFIYVLDSFDGITSEAATKLADDNIKKRKEGKPENYSYGAEKPKIAKRLFAQRVKQIEEDNSLLIVITQSIDDLNGNPMFKKKVRAGGKALKFFCSVEIWLGNKGKTKDTKTGIITAMTVEAKITKNRTNGMQRACVYNILSGYGVDNITSCIDFLIIENYWSKAGTKIDTKGFVPDLITQRMLIKHIEENDKETELDLLCKEAYDIRMERLRPKRKKRYGK